MATYSQAPTGEPYLPFRNLLKQDKDLSHAELAYQLSCKGKMAVMPLALTGGLRHRKA